MKPLSPLLYSMRNRKKVFVSIKAVMLAVSFLYILYSFTNSIMDMEMRNGVPIYEKAAVVMNSQGKPIDSSLIKEIKNNENVERVVPTIFNYNIRYKIPGVSDRASAVPIRNSDINYFMEKLGIKLIAGDLPKEGLKEIAINKDIAKNRGVKIGDKVGNNVNQFDTLPGEYEVVGVIDSESLISILSVNNSIYPNYNNEEAAFGTSFYVFSKEGKKAAMDKYISSLPNDKARYEIEKTVKEHAEKASSSLKVMDIIAILSIIVMVINVGSAKYAQYLNRKEELGLLNAIGYNKDQILYKTFKEVVIVNLIGFALGIIGGFIVSYLINKGLWEPSGARGFLYTTKGFVVSVFVPLFTILFSIIPINNLVNKLDPIKMIEKN
jgi:putative ABC transport system permease protein